ncbi:MAG TPA: xanthine dehydrogenase family protein subunit M [Candidatus Binatia bacterium]|jgi:carbon-monoxide dehydrogenase medium subunit
MTIRSFDLLRPRSLTEASELLVKHGDDARPIAGGTTLVILLKQRAVYYPCLVDLQAIAGLDQITEEKDTIRIGALVTHRTVELSPVIRKTIPVVAEAFGKIGNVRVRQTASVGGNLAHGDYRLDPPPALLILNASVSAHGPNGSREIPLKNFFKGMYETALEPEEILAEIRIPPMPEQSRAAYLKYSALSANDWPCLGVAACVAKDNGKCRELRLALGGVASTPVLIEGLEFVCGETLRDSVIDEVLKVVDTQISPFADLRGSEWYKRQMARVFVKKAIAQLGH